MTSLTEEGIFRLSGSSSEISKLKAIFCTPNTVRDSFNINSTI
jgi:hypothetical protein